jgi:hypothetical protein
VIAVKTFPRNVRLALALFTLIFAFLVLAATAVAGNPSGDQYGNVAGTGQGKAKGPFVPPATSSAVPAAQSSDTLPFTGVDLAVVAVGGAALLGGGMTLRRYGRKHRSQ